MTMRRLMSPVLALLALVTIGLFAFTATAFAADAATAATSNDSLLDLLRPVLDAFRGGHYIAAGALTVVFAVALVKRYSPGRLGVFVKTDAGGALTTLVVSFSGAIAASTISDDTWHWAIAWTAGGIAFAAAGGYAVVKKLLIAPLKASHWYATAPAWARSLLQIAFWVFDSETPEQAAERAGTDAVIAAPAAGAASIVRPPSDVA